MSLCLSVSLSFCLPVSLSPFSHLPSFFPPLLSPSLHFSLPFSVSPSHIHAHVLFVLSSTSHLISFMLELIILVSTFVECAFNIWRPCLSLSNLVKKKKRKENQRMYYHIDEQDGQILGKHDCTTQALRKKCVEYLLCARNIWVKTYSYIISFKVNWFGSLKYRFFFLKKYMLYLKYKIIHIFQTIYTHTHLSFQNEYLYGMWPI